MKEIDWAVYFEKYIENNFVHKIIFVKSLFFNGDFGDLVRFDFEMNNKLGTIECWSNGSVSFDIFDIQIEDQLYINFYLPEEVDKIKEGFLNFIQEISDGH